MATERQSRRLHSLAALARAVARSAPLLAVLKVAAEQALAALEAASVSVSRVEGGGRVVRTLINVGDLGPHEERWPRDETYPIGDYPSLRRTDEDGLAWLVRLDDPNADRADQVLLTELGKGSAVGVLMMVDGQIWGEFYATRFADDAPYGPDDLAYLEALGAIVAGAVSRALRESALEELAYHDPLTGLLNRRALDARSAPWFVAPAGVRRQVTAVVADINGLKRVNDQFGHVAGDRLLRSVAAALLDRFDRFPGALVARVGGDEFAALVPEAPVADVVAATDGLCAASWTVGVTADLSVGAATVTVSGDQSADRAALFVAADQAQYVAKRGHLHHTVLAGKSQPA